MEVHIPFCEDWAVQSFDNKPEAAQEEYVASELRRLVGEEAPILRAVLNCPEPWAQFLALSMLQSGTTSSGEEAPMKSTVYLRLVDPGRVAYEDPDTGEVDQEAAIPPPRDPQGRPLPRDKAGKVLVAKVGNLGGNIPPQREAAAHRAFGGDRRLAMAKAGKNLFLYKEVTRVPAAYSLRDAVFILRAWGYGVGDVVFRSPRAPDRNGRRARGLCQWLVEEVPETEALTAMAKARTKTPAKASEKGRE